MNIVFDDKVKNLILKTTTAQIENDVKRNSKENIRTWKNRLNDEEIKMIKSKTEHVWKEFYCEDDWN